MDNTNKANVSEMRPQLSKVKEIAELPVIEDPIILEIENGKPLVALDNPDEIVSFESIPVKIKDAVIEIYGESFFYNTEWTMLKLKKLNRAMTHPRENLTNSIAMICSPECILKETCPYDIIGRPPLGERCPIELNLAKMLTMEYFKAVAERQNAEVQVLQSDIILFNLIRELVAQDIVENRLNAHIGKDGLIDENPTVVNQQTGEVYYTDDETVAVRIKERVARRRDQLFRQLLATPEMAAKYKSKHQEDSIAKISETIDTLDKLATALLTQHTSDAELVDE